MEQTNHLIVTCHHCRLAVALTTSQRMRPTAAQLWVCPGCGRAHLVRTDGAIVGVTSEPENSTDV